MRLFPRTLRFWTAVVVVTYWCALQISPATAALAPSRVSGTTAITSARSADLVVVQRMLENRVVAQKLKDYGVTPSEAQLKVASMSDQDLHTLATASRGLPSGGDDLGVIVTLLVIVILVILIMKLMNKQIVVR